MAGFGASHQPMKSSVNFNIRLFCTIAATAGKIVNQTVHVSSDPSRMMNRKITPTTKDGDEKTMTSVDTVNGDIGGGVPSAANRLPPQAPSSSRSTPQLLASPQASSLRMSGKSNIRRISSSDADGTSKEAKSSRRSKRSSRREIGQSSRIRSASDGVKKMMMSESQQQLYQQQLYQQQQYALYQNHQQQQPQAPPASLINQQQQPQYYYGGGYPNQPAPPVYGFNGSPSSISSQQRTRKTSYDSKNYGAIPPPRRSSSTSQIDPAAMMNIGLPPRQRSSSRGSQDFANNTSWHGMDPSHLTPPPPHRRIRSKEFSAMEELSSVMRRPISSNQVGGQGSPIIGGNNAKLNQHHRRIKSDSMAQSPLFDQQQVVPLTPPLRPLGYYHHQNRLGESYILDPTNSYPVNNNAAAAVAQGSSNRVRVNSIGSHVSFHASTPPPSPRKIYELGPEAESLLQARSQQQQQRNAKKQSRTHMRQHSVNLYMKAYKGEQQPTSCKDVFFVILFILQLVGMAYVGYEFGPKAFVKSHSIDGMDDDSTSSSSSSPTASTGEDDTDDIKLHYHNIVNMASICGVFAIIVSALALAFMMVMSRRLVYVALVLSIGVSFAWGTIGIGISPQSFVPITGIITLLLSVGYMFVVWERIPFASANLTTAVTGVRDNLGLVGIAFFFQFMALVCSIWYSFAYVGLHDAMNSAEYDTSDRAKIVVHVLFLVSYYWTFQVLRHIVMVTVAGTIGSWWFGQSSALVETFRHSIIYNFGSVCYGSLFVGFVHFLQQITEGMRPNRDDSSMTCFYECSIFFQEKIVALVDSLADSFTPWAFTYVGMYHYGFVDAGHKVNSLFYNRGWTRIVTDDLISNVLAMVSLVIGGLCGSFAVILQAIDGHGLTNFGHPDLVSFMIGFMVGIVLSTVLFSIIDSSVCAVIVCFAGSPVEFQRIHPELSREMRLAWREVWPGSLDVDNSPAARLSFNVAGSDAFAQDILQNRLSF